MISPVCRLTTVVIISIGCAFAQTSPTVSADPADQEFAALQLAAQPLPIPSPAAGKARTHDDFLRDQKMQSSAFLSAADQAHAFYTNHPTHAKASDAKKIEVMSLVRAANTGATEVEPKALRLAREFRADMSNKSIDRFNVAMAAVEMDVRKKHIADQSALLAEYEKRAGDMLGEFPDEPAVYEIYVGVARNSDSVKARTLANSILRMPAPANVKEEAQAIIDRLDMPGKKLAFEFQDEAGKLYKIDDFKGKVVVFYVWATWSGAASKPDNTLSSLPSNVQLVSVNVDTDLAKGKTAKAAANFGGIAYSDDRGLSSPLPKQLRAARVPSVHVVDATGRYVGSGAVSDLSKLLAEAAK